MSWLSAIRARLRLLFARGAAESRMDEEIRLHLEMEADRLVREEGLDPREARRRARVAFGGVEKTKEELRDGRGLAWLSGLRLDLKLGVRMLLKYPVLTSASVLALAIAIALAASWFEFMSNMVRPQLPLDDGHRIVSLRNRDLAAAGVEAKSLHDFETWRNSLESVEELSAASPLEYNVTAEDGRFATLSGARVTPSMFRLVRVQPVLGRPLTEADLDPGSEPVAVIGYSAWQRVFNGDRTVVGETVRLGADYATVVGVMPEGFGFPVNQEIWTPLRESALDYERRQGPRLSMFGRLARGVDVGEAQAELTVIGQRTTAAHPATHEQIRPEVRLYGRGNDMSGPALLLNIPFLLFLLVVSANVATLLFARTATRGGEIAMRSALGASRRRIILQLIAESLVLTSLAAAVGVAAAHWALGWGMDLFWEVQQTRPPFWFSSGLSPATVLYVAALTVLGAIVIGGIPALRATGRKLRSRLTQAGAGGSGLKFGGIATGVIVVQVALCVAFVPVAIMNGQNLLPEPGTISFPAESYLSGRLVRQMDSAPARDAGAQAEGQVEEREERDPFEEVHRRLASSPGVTAATRASRIPGFNHPMEAIEIDGDSASVVEARQLEVDPNFFDVMDARIVSGRAFNESDVTAEAGVAIVDGAWAASAFGGQSPLGQRIRYPERKGEEGTRWYEIVGVVAGLDRPVGPGSGVGVLHPLRPEDRASVQVYLQTEGLPSAMVPQVQSLVTSVDPRLAMADLKPLSEIWRPVQRSDAFFVAALVVVALVILLFALIGIYALMSFTVAQRTREIGIRAALGADPRRIILSIFSRALGQIGIGIVLGAALVSLTVADSPTGLRMVAGVAMAMAVVGLLGCVLPAGRALRIQPVEALRAE